MRTLTPVVKRLLLLNVAVFVIVSFLVRDPALQESLVLWYPSDPKFQPWQLLTHAFMHASFTHILFNMIGLYFFGPVLEARLGPKNFLALYFAALFGAVLAHLGSIYFDQYQLQQAYEAFVANPSLEQFDAFFSGLDLPGLVYETYNGQGQVINRESAASIAGELQNNLAFGDRPEWTREQTNVLMQTVVEGNTAGYMLGASGAVSGVVAAFAVFYPQQKIMLLFPPIPVKAWIMVTIIFSVDLILGILELTGDNIAHFAHVGGAIVGAALAYYFSKTTTPPYMRRID